MRRHAVEATGDLVCYRELCSMRCVDRQLADDLSGSHDDARFASIRDSRATFLAASSSSGTWAPVPNQISSGVWPRNAE